MNGPKSICRCGHTGDGPKSEHTRGPGHITDGHGACTVSECPCRQFTWKSWTPEFRAHLMASPPVDHSWMKEV